MAKKTWAEKMLVGDDAKVARLIKPMWGHAAGTQMVILTPRLLDERVREIPFGETADPTVVRAEMAKRYGAEVCCPLTFGIFLRILSEAAWDDIESGKPLDEVTPFWRIVPLKGTLVNKLRCGRDWIDDRQKAEAAGLTH